MALRIRIASSVLVLGAVVLLLMAAFWPVMVALPGRLAQFITVVAVVLAVCGFQVPRGSGLAIASLWAAFGVSAALGVVGVWSGLIVFYAPAALLLVAAILISPYESEYSTKWDPQFVLIFAVVYGVTFMAGLGSGVTDYQGLSAASEQTYYVIDQPDDEPRTRHGRRAMHSTSTSEPRGSFATWTVDRDGGLTAK